MHRRALAVVLLLGCSLLPAQNSTRKVRTAPGELAARAGSAVEWRKDLDAALADAKALGRPVFAFVATMPGSPMDRQDEVERYLMAGPFSWPAVVDLLNTQFVPVRFVPSREQQAARAMRPRQYIEPGWLVLQADGTELQRVHELTTLHPEWIVRRLGHALGLEPTGFPCAAPLAEAWQRWRAGSPAEALSAVQAVLEAQPSPRNEAEARWLEGAIHFRSGRPKEAAEAWRTLVDKLPGEPLAWKAAMELEGHGPFVHGFEVYGPLPTAVLDAPATSSRAPDSAYAEAELWQRGLRFLLAMDDGTGMVRDSIYDFGGTDSLPNVHAAVTCLAGMALLEGRARLRDGRLPEDEPLAGAIDAMLARIVATAATEQVLALEDRDEILWAHAYRLRFLARWIELEPARREQLAPRMQGAIGALAALQPETGAWFHEYPNPFATATALQALALARDQGGTVDDAVVQRGLRALLACRARNGAYTYGHPRRGEPRATIPAAAGRMPLCELALRSWQQGSDEALATAVAAAFEHHGLLAGVRKYDDHADEHGYGGFFFWFDMLGRTEALLTLPKGELRDRHAAAQRALLRSLPEIDGCFVDSHELGRAYGTAMALICLAALDRG